MFLWSLDFGKAPPGFSPCILPDIIWFQPPLCQQVPPLLQSRLVHTVWHWVVDETNSQQMSTANQRQRKAHQNQGSALAVSSSGPARTHEELLYTEIHTQSTIKSSAGTNPMAKFMFKLQPNTDSASVFQAWGTQNPHTILKFAVKVLPRLFFSGHREQNEIIHFPSFTSSWTLRLGKMCLTQPLAVMALGESRGWGQPADQSLAQSQHPDTGTKYRIFFPF